MQDQQLSFRKSANIDRVTDKRKDSLFRLVDTDGSGTIDAQEFAVLYDAIKKDLAEELEKEAALEKEASSARRRFKMLMLFVAVLVSFLAASVAANFAVIFTVVDDAITTTTSSTGFLEDKRSGMIAKTALATEDVPLYLAPVLDMDALGSVKSMRVSYGIGGREIKAHFDIVAVRKHNTTFVEFVTSVPGQTVEALNGVANYVIYPTGSETVINPARAIQKYKICAANATCSAFKAGGIDIVAATATAKMELENAGFSDAARRLQPTLPYLDSTACGSGTGSWVSDECTGTTGCAHSSVAEMRFQFWNGYTGDRHVVFFMHGLFSDYDQMWDMFCPSWTGPAPASCVELEHLSFRHLVFVFPSSSASPVRWGSNPLNSLTYRPFAGKMISDYVCGTDTAIFVTPSTCPETGGFLTDYTYGGGTSLMVGDASSIMVVGYSDGGGVATFMNWAYGHKVTKAVAIDYHGFNGANQWLDHWSLPHAGDAIALKAYTTCDSQMYTTDAITTGNKQMPTEASLSATTPAYSTETYAMPGFAAQTFKQFYWAHPSDGRYLTWAVHGLTTSNLNGGCDSSSMGGANADYHAEMKKYHGAVQDILDWVTAPSPPPVQISPSPPPSPPAQSPAPPPSPVGGGIGNWPSCDNKKWCCPIKPEDYGPFMCKKPPQIGKKLKPSVCTGPTGYQVPPVPCEELPYFEICRIYQMDPAKARDMASRLRPPMKLESVPCVYAEICEIAEQSLDKAIEKCFELDLDPQGIWCIAGKYQFWRTQPPQIPCADPASARCNSECAYDYICSMIDIDYEKAHQLSWDCHKVKSPYQLPGC